MPRSLLKRFRPSFTLVELLVAIAIIGIMAGMILFSLAGAQTDANITRTRGTIGKINSVILQEWEKFRYRAAKIDIPPAWFRPMTGGTLAGQRPLAPIPGARLRLNVLRDLMRMELPDRFTDLLYPPTSYPYQLRSPDGTFITTYSGIPTSGDLVPAPGIRIVPGKYNNLRERISRASRAGDLADPIVLPTLGTHYSGSVAPAGTVPDSTADPTLGYYANQGAECLYQIVASSNSQGGNALEAFRASEIGDTDGDGLLEFLDGWGQPIEFIRWPVGFASPLNSTAVPDPMDPLRADPRWSTAQPPWLLIPLIYSPGPDGRLGLVADYWPEARVAYAQRLDPYDHPRPKPEAPLIGSAFDISFEDNITNYDLILE